MCDWHCFSVFFVTLVLATKIWKSRSQLKFEWCSLVRSFNSFFNLSAVRATSLAIFCHSFFPLFFSFCLFPFPCWFAFYSPGSNTVAFLAHNWINKSRTEKKSFSLYATCQFGRNDVMDMWLGLQGIAQNGGPLCQNFNFLFIGIASTSEAKIKVLWANLSIFPSEWWVAYMCG